MSEIDRILEEEGFRSKPYQDHLGNWTFGHGLTYITEEESRWIALRRYNYARDRIEFLIDGLSRDSVKKDMALAEILAHMAYQLGFSGVVGFKKMWVALGKRDYKAAAAEMRDSKWYTQTPERAERLAKRMEALSAD